MSSPAKADGFDRPPRWSAAQAGPVVAAWRSSGLRLSVWCRQTGNSAARLRYWSRLLTESDAEPASFLPLEPIAADGALEVRLPIGASVWIGVGFNARLLRDVVEALR